MSSLLPDLSQREISEQPDATQKLLDVGWPDNQEIASTLKREKNRYMFLAAGGTSDNAGLFAKYLQV
jgi:glucosamine--fructose-6-phosphate aminotransferase (isomerizing)